MIIQDELRFDFIKEQHAQCPSVIGWWLVVKPEDLDTHISLHKMVTTAAVKWGNDPHEFNSDGTPRRPESPSQMQVAMQNPILFGAKWFGITLANLLSGRAICVNPAGGWHPLTNQTIVLARESRNRLEWPGKKDDLWQGEIITIMQWGDGKHFYLSSNKDRIFAEKCNQFEEAERIAKQYVKSDAIRFLREYSGKRDGD